MATTAVPMTGSAGAGGSTPPPPASGDSKRKRVLDLHTQLVNERSTFDPHWKSINKVLFPRRARFTLSDANIGTRRDQDIVDSTATFAGRTCASGIMSGTTNPVREWFRVTTSDPDLAERARVKQFLHELTQAMRATLLRSNFYDVIHSTYGDFAVYGTSPFLMEEDDEDVVRFENFPVGCYCLANDRKRRVRTFTREFRMTTEQLVTRFGWDKVTDTVHTAWRGGQLNQWFDVVHVIAENREFNPQRLGSQFKRFYSCYVQKDAPENTAVLGEGGYDEFPIFAARWDVTAEDVYATDCPGMTALGDIKQLQLGEKRALQAIDKHVNPPLVAPPALRNSVISQIPGGVTYGDVDGRVGVRPLFEIKPALEALEMKQMQVRQRINQAFYADLFRMAAYLDESKSSSSQPRTAYEWDVRQQEKLMALGPVLQRLDRDVYDGVITRLFNILYRRGELPDIPPELEDSALKVEYISILHTAQKSGGLGSMERFLSVAKTIAETAAEDATGALLKIDFDQMIDEHADASGIPPRVVRPDEEVAAMRAAQKAEAQKAQEAATLRETAGAAKDLAASDTSGKNALTDTLNGIAQAAGGPAGGQQ